MNFAAITRKRRLKWVVILPLGDINTEAWSCRMGVGHLTVFRRSLKLNVS
jgi:hypothetical protein